MQMSRYYIAGGMEVRLHSNMEKYEALTNAPISEGAFGKVYPAIRREDSKRVAIKVVMKKRVIGWVSTKTAGCCFGAKKIPCEVAFLYRLKGVKGVIDLVDYWADETYCYIVMERPKNATDLFDYIAEFGSLNEDVARHIFYQLLKVLRRLARFGICHRDIKMENILICADTLKVWLIDFGAASFTSEAPSQIFRGTHPPPEFLIGGQYFMEEGDVWSLGVTLLRALTAEHLLHTQEEITRASVKIPKPLSRECYKFLVQALARDALLRPSIWQLSESSWMK